MFGSAKCVCAIPWSGCVGVDAGAVTPGTSNVSAPPSAGGSEVALHDRFRRMSFGIAEMFAYILLSLSLSIYMYIDTYKCALRRLALLRPLALSN